VFHVKHRIAKETRKAGVKRGQRKPG